MLLSSTGGSVGVFAASSLIMSFMADEAASLLERLDLHSAAQGDLTGILAEWQFVIPLISPTVIYTQTHTTCECMEMILPLF